jgi:hypothetical protein
MRQTIRLRNANCLYHQELGHDHLTGVVLMSSLYKKVDGGEGILLTAWTIERLQALNRGSRSGPAPALDGASK